MCGRPHGAAVRRVRWPTHEYEYDGVWNEACANELSIFPTTTGAPPHEFQTYLNQQDGVLARRERTHGANAHLQRLRLVQGPVARFHPDRRATCLRAKAYV